ncbi:NADH-quinone oxidoreductase subunit A [SAR202 cluster bacterium AD-802-E10_MRT_200m]|nr:NADH-quinone oxidoreductase subunit A [SAR202 cluster bacterium AD-802-E10_MRT_200m]
MLEDYYRQYGFILILTAVAVVIPSSMLLLSWVAQILGVRPRKPSLTKSEIYECGMETIGGRWVQFNFRYYLYTMLFLVFDVTAVFVYPWAIQMKSMGLFAFFEMMAFIAILGLGWLYAWKKGALEWR